MSENIKYKDVFRFAMHYWRKRPVMGCSLLGLMLAATIVDAFIPVYTGKIIDALVGNENEMTQATSEALVFLGIFALLAVTFNILRYAAISLWASFAVKAMYELLTEAMQKVQRFSADWHANTFAGGTVRKITRGMWSFDLFGDTLFMGLYTAAIVMLGMTAILLYHLPIVGIFTAIMIVVYSGISIWMSVKIMAPKWRRSAESDTKVGATLADIITGHSTVQSFGAEAREDKIFDEVASSWRNFTSNAWLTSEVANLIRGLLRTLMLVGMVGLTVWLWQKGRASPGDIALALTSCFIIGGYLRDIGMHIAHLQKSVSEMEDIVSFWMREDEIQDIPNAKELQVSEGRIAFNDVTFIYSNKGEPIYDGLNVVIEPGEKVALVGHSGSGKSTFVKLLQRLYDVQKGEILIDEQNISNVRQDSLRRNIALVPQEPILFHRSLAENIAYGKTDASMDEIIEAAKKAYAHEFIQNMPEGYSTLVGERGVKLSGGERQRVAIARAILADAPILILDEATSALDSVSEHYIQAALESLMEGRTTITIAHRLATIKSVDRILVFDQGKVVEQGTHDELVDQKQSHYHKLFEMQALDLVGSSLNEQIKAAE
jgi:ATP-binding cassette subfamily B protein